MATSTDVKFDGEEFRKKREEAERDSIALEEQLEREKAEALKVAAARLAKKVEAEAVKLLRKKVDGRRQGKNTRKSLTEYLQTTGVLRVDEYVAQVPKKRKSKAQA